MNINEIKNHLYNDSEESALKYVKSISDEETLYVYANNYNWDNGFEIPTAIINSPVCTLSIALQVFHLADGLSYLSTKCKNAKLPDWSNFIERLYTKIATNSYVMGEVSFTPELTKVQLLKLKKTLPESDLIFITEIDGSDCNIIF